MVALSEGSGATAFVEPSPASSCAGQPDAGSSLPGLLKSGVGATSLGTGVFLRVSIRSFG